MLDELNVSKSEVQETDETLEKLDTPEDPESAALEDVEPAPAEDVKEGEVPELTEEEKQALQDSAGESAKSLLEQYAMDEQTLQELEKQSNGEDADGDSAIKLTVENGSSCGYGNGCSGSSWCYGCGDLR